MTVARIWNTEILETTLLARYRLKDAVVLELVVLLSTQLLAHRLATHHHLLQWGIHQLRVLFRIHLVQ